MHGEGRLDRPGSNAGMRALLGALLCLGLLPSASGAQWLYLSLPSEWNEPAGIRPYPAFAGERIRTTGEAYHPGGVLEVRVAGITVEIARGPHGTATFDATFTAGVQQDSLPIEVVPASGVVFVKRFPLRPDPRLDAARYGEPWAPLDELVLVVGVPDTLRIRLQAAPHEVIPPAFLKWSSSNPGVISVGDRGIVTPVSPGSAAIEAAGFERRATVLVRVYPRPGAINFTPHDSAITIAAGARFVVRADLWLGSDQWLRGVVPQLAGMDTIILRHEGQGIIVGVRPGETTLQGAIAGQQRVWRVKVIPPAIRARLKYGSLLLGSTAALPAERITPDGDPIGPAVGADWRSTDTTVVSIVPGGARARAFGTTVLSASLGPEQDTTTVFVLGDLLLEVAEASGPAIITASIGTGKTHRITEPGTGARDPSLSPDGRIIAFVAPADGGLRVHLMDPDGRNVKPLVPPASRVLRLSRYAEYNPRWTHDGQRVLFASDRSGNYEIYSIRHDGTDLKRLTDNAGVDRSVSSAPDVPLIAFERVVGAGDSDIIVASEDGLVQTIYQAGRNTKSLRTAERRPLLFRGGGRLLYARGAHQLDERAGETLAVLDMSTNLDLIDLVAPRRDHELVFALSPDGTRIAYHERATRGRRNAIVTVIDLDGATMAVLTVSGVRDIREIAWGALHMPGEAEQ